NGTGVNAIHGIDYEALPGMVVIPAGETSAAVTITPRFDGLGEGAENVQFQLGAGPTNYRLGPNNNAVITINDNAADTPYIGVIQMTNAAEPSTSGIFRISARGAGTSTLTVNYTMSGTAVAGTDYNIAGIGSTTITLNNGAEVTKDISVVPVNNATADPLRTITMTLTPATAYQMFAPTSAATMWLRDDDQPTVYVDAHQITTPATITESGTGSKFYLSRTGSTSTALVVNYLMGGTAVNGTDYTAVSGTATIAAGTTGTDVIITPVNNTTFTGTRTIILNLAAGSYAAGPAATMYLTDDETSTQKVSFQTSGATGSESIASVSIPVSLTTAAAVPTTVEYWADTGARSSASTTALTAVSPALALPYWVRVVRSGSSFTNYFSRDGINWIQRGITQTINMSSTSYLAGLAAAGGLSGFTCAASFDGVSVTGLDAGGSAGIAVSGNVGAPSPAGSDSLNSGVYTVTGGGNPDLLTGTTEGFRYVSFPITNSANCTITARVVTLTAGAASGKAGVMIRESMANNAIHDATMVMKDTTTLLQIYRLSTGASGVTNANFLRPWWVRLQRAGDVFSSYGSPDGATWTQLGTSQTVVLAPEVLAGIAVSARSDGLLSTATFDNVTLSGSTPVLQGRTVGFVNAQGGDSLAAGVYTVAGSGNAIGGTEDECHFVAMPKTGDFVLTARVLNQAGGAVTAQAGVMIREQGNYRARSLYTGMVANSGLEFIYRNSTVTNAAGDGIDHTLTNGVLTFNPGDITQNISFNVLNDALTEPNESVVITLKNPFNAVLGTIPQFTYTILNDDTLTTLPYVGFAAAASTAVESAGTNTLWITLSTPAPGPVSVDYSVTGGTAVNGTDFILADGTLNFATGDSALPVSIPVLDNAAAQPNRTVVLTLSNPLNSALGSQTTHVFTIVDDDLPVVTIVANHPAAAESGTAGQFTVSRTGATTSALTVTYSLTGSTALNGTDYTAIPVTVTLAAGQSSAVINVNPIQDSLNEGTELVVATLSANAAYTIGSPATATVSILDDDRPVISIVATQPNAAEGGAFGQFTLTRGGATGIAITANLAISGTATNTTDYTTLPATVAFAANQTTATLNVVPVNDTLIEGPETVMITLNTGSYDIGTNNSAVVTIADNDVPPSIYISNPSAQAPLIATGNGLIVSVTATDDGLPSPLTYSWVQASGPGSAVFESPAAATSAVTFSADGVYILKVNVSDGQYTVSDQVTAIVGNAIAPADWLAHDLTPSITQRGQSWVLNNIFTLTGMGAGYTGTTDGAHVMIRPVSGSSTIIARLSSLTGVAATPLAGVTMRDSEFRGSRRAVLGYVPGTGLQFRVRTTSSAVDTVTTQAGVTLPVWLKLDRDSSTNLITASYANDVSGVPGSWTQIGVPTAITMDTMANIGITATGTSTTNAATAVFDNVTPTPAVVAGGALLAEDAGTSNPTAGASSFNAATGTWTLAATGSLDSGGYFVGEQYFGDIVVTAKLASATSGALNALSGILIREGMDGGGYVFVGRIPTSSFSGYIWRNYANGTTGGVPSFTQSTRWMRLVRAGNNVTAYHAPDVSGSPGVWVPLGQPQTVIMTTPVLVGLAVDNAGGGSVLNTATFTNFSVVPLNKAPVVSTGGSAFPIIASTALGGSVTDDSFPSPPALTTSWSTLAGPASVVFGNASMPATSAAFPANGSYTLRLQASDGSAQTFADLSLTAYLSRFDQWQTESFGGTSGPAMAQAADYDHDGLPNLLEYALGTSGITQNATPIVHDLVPAGNDKYLQITVPKNPLATDVTLTVEATGTLAVPASWSSTGLIIVQDTSTVLQVRDNVPATENAPRFMRVRVTRP
ncbi:MAG: Calx-beta protein, partial [Verrucomicrobiaceae bacterium]|nr:Calx-beta protein [Verrucomicrobiaceae bacterium]